MRYNGDGDSLIGIDVGTSVTKTLLFDLQGNELKATSQSTKLIYRHSLWVECDMTDVLGSVIKSVRTLVEMAKASQRRVIAIGITGQGDGTWLIDGNSLPVRPAITWLDGRSGSYVEQFDRTGVSRDVFRLTGSVLSTSNQAVQLRWLKDHEPESLRRARAAIRAKDWVYYGLTGTLSTDFTDASHTYFNIHTKAYDKDILHLIGVDDLSGLLPEARPSYENKAKLLPSVASEIGLRAGTPVVSGPFDVVASDLGVGAIHPGDACTVLGTAGIHQIITKELPKFPEQIGYTMCHAPSDLWIRCLPTMTGTLNTEWFVREIYFGPSQDRFSRSHGDAWNQIEDAVRSVPFGSRGVMYHPFIDSAGERAPFVRHSARAQFTGLSIGHDRTAMARAVYEGVVLSAIDCYSHLSRKIERLRLTGGGCRSSIWPEMFADALGCPVQIVEGQEAGAKGAVINAAVSLGIFESYEDSCSKTVRLSREILPTSGMSEKYARLLELYRRTYTVMLPIWDDLQSFFANIEEESP